MSGEATSPTAVVNNAIMAAADEILAGLKGGNFFPSLPVVTTVPDLLIKGEQKHEPHGSVSPTAVHHHHHDHTKIIAEEQANTRPHADSFVSHSSQVTFDSRDGGGDGLASAGDINKIASASSLTSSEVSHHDGNVHAATHQGQVLQGPPMQQVTFPSGTGASPPGTAAYHGTGAKRAAVGPCDGIAEPRPLQKPRLSPMEGDSSCVPTQTTGTPVTHHPKCQQQSELIRHQPSTPPPAPTQTAGHLTFQPILPAVASQEDGSTGIPPAQARVLHHQHQTQAQEPVHHHQESQQHQGQGHHQQTPHHQLEEHTETRTNIFTLDHHTYTLGHDPRQEPAYDQTYTTFEMADERAEQEVKMPVRLAPKPTELDSQETAHHHYQQSILVAPQPHIAQNANSNVHSLVPPENVNLPAHPQPMVAAGATTAPPASYPPIYPRPCPTLECHNHQSPPKHHLPAPSVTQPHVPAPSPNYAQLHHVEMPSFPALHTHLVDTSNIQLDHMHHQQHSHTTQSAAMPPGHGETGELPAAHSHPYTSTTTRHAHHYQHSHSVNNHRHGAMTSHAPFVGVPGITAAAPTPAVTRALMSPAFPNQSHGSTSTTTTAWVQPSIGLDAVLGYGHPAVNDPGQGSQDLGPNLRNQKMQPTDCLLFAASLLQEGPCPAAAVATHPGRTLAQSSEWMEAGTAPAASASLPASGLGGYIPTATAPHYTVQGSTSMGAALSPAPAVGAVPAQVYPAAEAGVGVPEPAVQRDRPQDLDVLCGRGGLINKHVGNIIYRKVCEYNKPFYQTVQKRHRILVSQSIVHTILKRGGRFLSEDTKAIANPDGTQTTFTAWKPVATARAIQKTSQALRERLASKDNDSNGSQNGAAT